MCWVLRNHGITSQWPGFVTKRHRRLEQPSNPSIKSHWSKAVRFGTRATPSRMFWSRPQKSDIFRATKYEKGLKKGVIRIFFRNMQWNKVMWAPSIPGHCWRWRKAVSKSRENESFCDSFWHGAVGLCFLLLCMGETRLWNFVFMPSEPTCPDTHLSETTALESLVKWCKMGVKNQEQNCFVEVRWVMCYVAARPESVWVSAKSRQSALPFTTVHRFPMISWDLQVTVPSLIARQIVHNEVTWSH